MIKYTMAEIRKENGKEYIEDYRIDTKDNKIVFKRGNLKDLTDGWLFKSQGLGDLLGSFNSMYEWNDNLVIVKYSGGYAIGK